MKIKELCVLILMFFGSMSCSFAQDGVDFFNVIAFGRPDKFSDSKAVDIRMGIECVFSPLNKNGGVRGRSVKILEFDDAGDAKKTKVGVSVLKKKYNVIGLFMPTQKYLKESIKDLDEVSGKKIFTVAASSGSSENIISAYPSIEFKSKVLVDYAIQSGYEKIFIMANDEIIGRIKTIKPSGKINWTTINEADVVLSFSDINETVKKLSSEKNVKLVLSGAPATDVGSMSDIDGWIFADSIVSMRSKKSVVESYKDKMSELFPNNKPTIDGLRAYMWSIVVKDALMRIDGEITSKSFEDQMYRTRALDIGGITVSIKQNEGWSWANLMMARSAGNQWVE